VDENPNFEALQRQLDAILESGDEELIELVEDVIEEAYEAVANGKELPADWVLRVMTRLQAIQAKDECGDN
jgi:hypothetical protein